MKSAFITSIFKMFFVAGLLVWAGQLSAGGCQNINAYDICMYSGYNSCSQTMTRCTSDCPNPPPPPPNCDTLCSENLYNCQNGCYQDFCL